jgi:hypothetical protein
VVIDDPEAPPQSVLIQGAPTIELTLTMALLGLIGDTTALTLN